jgi:hypothetical protein
MRQLAYCLPTLPRLRQAEDLRRLAGMVRQYDGRGSLSEDVEEESHEALASCA